MNIEYPISKVECKSKRSAFSLMEVLIAVGTLALGMLFIASVFPAGLYLTTVSSERTIAAVVADEAFAKIRLYGIPAGVELVDTNHASLSWVYPDEEYAYPSTPTTDPNSKRYWWSAICRRIDTNDVQVTVFVSRKVGTGTRYYMINPAPPPALITIDRPVAVKISVTPIIGSNLQVNAVDKSLINDGSTIVDDASGDIYRVLERYRPPNDSTFRLDKSWQGGNAVWVVPPPVGGGRNPCIAVYQKIMRF